MNKYAIPLVALVVAVIVAVVASRPLSRPPAPVHPQGPSSSQSSPGPSAAASHSPQNAVPELSKLGSEPNRVDASQSTTGGVDPVSSSKAQILEAINQAAITYSADQLPAIAPYLNSPDPELRAAALDGVVLLGNAAGAKLLRNAASNLTDPAEIVKFREKADYLELPSLPKEAILARIKAAKARRASSARTGTGTGTKP